MHIFYLHMWLASCNLHWLERCHEIHTDMCDVLLTCITYGVLLYHVVLHIYVLCLVTISHHCITSHIRMRTDSVNTCYPGLVVLSECSVPCSVVDSL